MVPDLYLSTSLTSSVHRLSMPRTAKRQRIVFCDCKECNEVLSNPDDEAWEAAAKQTPPPRSLVLVLEGFNQAPRDGQVHGCCSIDDVALPHFDAVARQGVTFCAATRKGRPCAALCMRAKHLGGLCKAVRNCFWVAQLPMQLPMHEHPRHNARCSLQADAAAQARTSMAGHKHVLNTTEEAQFSLQAPLCRCSRKCWACMATAATWKSTASLTPSWACSAR